MDLNGLIRSVDIVEYISQYVDLVQKGDEWWGLSCFKDEKTPSFSVRKNPPFFYDYSSGIGGNIFTFIKSYFGCTSQKAVEILKNYAGYEGEISVQREHMDITSILKKYKGEPQIIKASTGIVLPDDYMDRYERKKEALKIWMDEGISKESLEKFQVRYDSFSQRLVYPIRNLDGSIVNVGGRAIGDRWKEEGQKKYMYFFHWGTINTIYGVSENIEYIKDKREIILFEGCKSVLLADTWGIHNTGAILTSHLSKNQMVILAKMGFDVVFALDKEIDVRKDKNVRKLSRYVNVFMLDDKKDLLGAKDAPVDKGKDVFEELYRWKVRL